MPISLFDEIPLVHKRKQRMARDAGLSRESLYIALSGDRSPSFDTILKVMKALDLRIHAEAVA